MDVVWFSGWDVILRTLLAGTVTYVILITLLRVTGPRTLAKWYAFDLIITVALGSTFANGVLSKDISVAQAVAGFLLLISLQYAINKISQHWPRFVSIVNPAPVLLLFEGEFQDKAMKRNRVSRADVCKALRAKGHAAYEQVAAVVLEPDGTFSIVEKMEQDKTAALEDIPELKRLLEGRPKGRKKTREKGALA